MKLRIVGMWALLMAMGINVIAQDEFSDEDLSKYATVMKWAKDEQGRMSQSVSDQINQNEMLPAQVYKDLEAALEAGDINSTEATEEQVSEFMMVQKRIDSLKGAFKTVYVDKIKNDIGAGLYNKLKKALKVDEAVKARYDAIMVGLQEETTEEEDSKE